MTNQLTFAQRLEATLNQSKATETFPHGKEAYKPSYEWKQEASQKRTLR